MKVSELIILLKGLPQNEEVILASDPEGNNYSMLSGWGFCHYRGQAWSLEVGEIELTPELIAEGFSVDDIMPNGKPGIILYPI